MTSKLNNSFHEPEDARRTFDETVEKLGGLRGPSSSSIGLCRRNTAVTTSRLGRP